MLEGEFGKLYGDGETIVQKRVKGEDIYVILEGQVEVVIDGEMESRRFTTLGDGDFFGEMEMFDATCCRATVRAMGHARVLKVDQKIIQNDPSLALHFLRANRLVHATQ